MNDLVYAMYNLKLKSKLARKSVALPFEDIHFDDECISKDANEENVEQVDDTNAEQIDGDVGQTSGVNIELGRRSSNPILNDNVEDIFHPGWSLMMMLMILKMMIILTWISFGRLNPLTYMFCDMDKHILMHPVDQEKMMVMTDRKS